MFPLGSPLLPHMPLPLRVFEPRYLAMLATILGDEHPRFGVVLIERGGEVGGADARFSLGTVAEVVEVQSDDASVVLLVRGGERIAVEDWLPDDPFPRAEVTGLPPLPWGGEDADRLARAEVTVRRALAAAAEFVELPWGARIELDDDPVARSWQLAGIAPVGELDRFELLASASIPALLDGVAERTRAALETLRFRVGGPGDEDALG